MVPGRCAKLLSLAHNFHKLCTIQPKASLVASPVRCLVRWQHQRVLPDRDDDEETRESQEVIKKVNRIIHDKSYGRLFAVIQVAGKQYKVTDEDLVVVDGFWPPSPGDKIRLEKVLLVGGADFTLVGRPLLPKDQVSVYATIIEKNMSPSLMHFQKIRRKRYKRTKLEKIEQTFLRITSIDIHTGVNESPDVDGVKDRIF